MGLKIRSKTSKVIGIVILTSISVQNVDFNKLTVLRRELLPYSINQPLHVTSNNCKQSKRPVIYFESC